MAQKPRTQDNYQPGLVSATPAIQAIGGTNQAVVQGIPKDNNYLRLSRSLAQFSNILGQASNINQLRGVDAAKGLTAQQLDDIVTGKVPDPDGGPLGALGFQKAFQQTSAKRWYETVGVQKYADLENKIDAKLDDYIKNGYDISKAKALVQEDVGALSMEIQQQFADKTWGAQVSNLLGGELSSRVMAGALKGYEKKQKAYLDGVLKETIRNDALKVLSGDIAPNKYFAEIEQKGKERGWSNSQINEVSKGVVVDLTETLINRGRLSEAEVFLKQAESVQVEGRPINQTLDMAKSASILSAKIRRAKASSDEETLVRSSQLFEGTYVDLIDSLKQFKVADTDTTDLENTPEEHAVYKELRKDITETVTRLKTQATPEEIVTFTEELVNALNKEKEEGEGRLSQVLDNHFEDLVRGGSIEKTSDDSRNIWDKSRKAILEYNLKASQLTPVQIRGGYSKEEKDLLGERALLAFEKDNTLSVTGFMKLETDGTQKPPQQVNDAWIEAHKTAWVETAESYKNIKSRLKQTLDIVADDPTWEIRGLKSAEGLAADILLNKEDVLRDALKEAAKIIEEQVEQGTLNEGDRIDEIQKVAKELLEKEQNQFRRRLEAEANLLKQTANKKKLETPEELKEDVSGTNFPKTLWFSGLGDKDDLEGYDSLFHKDKLKAAFEGNVTDAVYGNVRVDLRKARKEKNTKVIKLIQSIYGYPEFDEENVAKDLQDSLLSWYEIKLFNETDITEYEERFNKVAEAYIDKDEFEIEELLKRNVTLNVDAQTEKDLQTMLSLGIYSRGLLEDFFEIQKQFFNR